MIISETNSVAVDLATTLAETWVACDPEEALPSGDPRYVDLGQVRGDKNLVEDLARQITWTDIGAERAGSRRFRTLLVTGHRGCGKTTELLRLQSRLQDEGYFVVYFDAEPELNLDDVEWADIFLALVRQLEEQIRQSPLNLRLPQAQFDRIASWLAQVVLKSEDRTEVESKLTTEFGIKAELPFFARVSALVGGLVSGASSEVKEVRREIERRASVLIADINGLLDGLFLQLKDADKKGLVIIADGLEKILLKPLDPNGRLTSHNAIYIHHGDHLKALHAHVVYTIPISLLSDENVGQVFPDSPLVIPMVKVKTPTGRKWPQGVGMMSEIIRRRVDVPRVFQHTSLLENLCLASGGQVRDFLRLVRFSCRFAREIIDKKAVSRAIEALVDDYDYLVKDADLQRLVKVHREKRLPFDREYAHLPYHVLVLEYRDGDKKWADVHPAVQANKKFQEAWRSGKTAVRKKRARRT